jgi:hypothetical protein
MKAYELQTGDWFTVDPPDPEYHIRICLPRVGPTIRWGFPTKPDFWSYMGTHCNVTLVNHLRDRYEQVR